MREFALKQPLPVDDLKEGQDFNVHAFPEGTIFKARLSYYTSRRYETERGSERVLGRICEIREAGERGLYVLSYSLYHLSEPLAVGSASDSQPWPNIFTIGDTIHRKDRVNFLGHSFLRKQRLLKYNDIQILRLGESP